VLGAGEQVVQGAGDRVLGDIGAAFGQHAAHVAQREVGERRSPRVVVIHGTAVQPWSVRIQIWLSS
jgi:hypothetical protein